MCYNFKTMFLFILSFGYFGTVISVMISDSSSLNIPTEVQMITSKSLLMHMLINKTKFLLMFLGWIPGSEVLFIFPKIRLKTKYFVLLLAIYSSDDRMQTFRCIGWKSLMDAIVKQLWLLLKLFKQQVILRVDAFLD